MIDINNMSNIKILSEQYNNIHNLKVRKSLHEKYSTNLIGFQKWMFNQYQFSSKIKVLELGSGRGEMWSYYFNNKILQDYDMDITLSDFSEGMVEHLQQIYQDRKIDIKKIDILEIPFENESFDLVIANSMLYHVKDIMTALSEVKRVMKKNGKFYSATFGLNGMTQYLFHAFEQLGINYNNGMNISFTLQNGKQLLEKMFEKVERYDYEDALEIDKLEDYLDYIYSMASLQGLDRKYYDVLLNYFRAKQVGGYLHVPKEYGMFLATK
ncbi:methyltransferase type 11 [Lachnospiraceae bacterium KM106-2]|nr:methyltransferase type 11 [Lachnospiraceae bacterium KM106-2]